MWSFKTLQKTGYNFDRLFHSNHSPTNSYVFPWKALVFIEVHSHRTNSARNDTYFTKSKRSYFLFAPPPNPPPPPGTGTHQTIPYPEPKGTDLSQGLTGEGGLVTGQIEPWISTWHAVVTMKGTYLWLENFIPQNEQIIEIVSSVLSQNNGPLSS